LIAVQPIEQCNAQLDRKAVAPTVDLKAHGHL